jgi:hypothetical protein
MPEFKSDRDYRPPKGNRIVVTLPVSGLIQWMRRRKVRKRREQAEIDRRLKEYFDDIDNRKDAL